MNVNAPNDTVTDGVALIARIVMSMMFITSGIGKIVGFGPTVEHIAAKGVPLPEIAAPSLGRMCRKYKLNADPISGTVGFENSSITNRPAGLRTRRISARICPITSQAAPR